MTPVDPARREARGAPSIAAAMTGLWLVAWVGWVLYRHAQPGGATIEWIVAGAFGVGPAVARVAAWRGLARPPGRGLLACELLALGALAFGQIELTLALGAALCAGLSARGRGGPEAPLLHRLGQLAVLLACAALSLGYASNRPSMEPRFLLALPTLYESFRGPRGGDAAVRRVAGAAGVAAFALCRYEPLWGVLLGGWSAGCAGFALSAGGRRRALRVLVPLVVCALGVGALDLGLRVAGAVRPLPPSPVGDGLGPGAETPVWRGLGPDGEEVVNPIHYNAPPLGEPMHDVDHALTKPAGVRRLLVLGDSFVEGVHVPTDALFHRRLGAALDRPDRPVEAISLSRSGWGQAEELAQLRDVGVRYAPDLVLVEFLPLNDVRDNWPELEHLAEGEIARASWARPLEHDARRKGLVGLSELAHQADRVWRWLRQGSAAPLDEQVYLEHPTRLPEAWAQAWARTEALFLELQAEAAAAGARLAVVIFPSRPELLPGGEREYPARRVRTLCEAHGIPVLDLTPGFAADPDHARAYLQRNAHWSVHGHARAAAATAAWVEANDLLR